MDQRALAGARGITVSARDEPPQRASSATWRLFLIDDWIDDTKSRDPSLPNASTDRSHLADAIQATELFFPTPGFV